MSIQDLLDSINTEQIAIDTLEFVKVKSETGEEGDGSRFLADLLEREGFVVEFDEFEPDRPNIYTHIKGTGNGDGRSLVFNGHTDTIPIGNSAPPGREGDWIIGRGTEDMKGGLVAMAHAASALKNAGVELAGDLWLTGVVGHESPIGKKEGPKRLIERLLSGKISADAIIIVEGPCAVWTTSLGSTIFNITIRSDLGPIHTIKIPYISDNPVYWLGKLLREFEQMEERFTNGPSHPLAGRNLLNVGMVHGGDWFNRLPTEIKVSGTRRWTPGQTVEDIRAEFQAICDELQKQSGLSFSLMLEGFREPFETPSDHPIVTSLQKACESVTGKIPDIMGMGLVGDANLYANDGGVQTVYYGPAHQTAHSDDERVSISQLVHCAKVYALAAVEFCGLP